MFIFIVHLASSLILILISFLILPNQLNTICFRYRTAKLWKFYVLTRFLMRLLSSYHR
jgi:hypothetical protein